MKFSGADNENAFVYLGLSCMEATIPIIIFYCLSYLPMPVTSQFYQRGQKAGFGIRSFLSQSESERAFVKQEFGSVESSQNES